MSALDRRSTLDIVRRVLAADFSCDEESLAGEGTHFFSAQDRPGRRRFHRRFDGPSLGMVTMGNGVVVTCSPDRLNWATENLSGLERDELFSVHVLARVEAFITGDDQLVYGPNLVHVCSPDTLRQILSPAGVDLFLVEREGIPDLYQHTGFRNALGRRPDSNRPNVLATTATCGDTLVGIAGASADSNDLWQIGVDVLAEYRGRGIGQALVQRLAAAICARGKIPYYATVASNLASRNVANSAGFWPCWIEAGSYGRSRLTRS